MEEKLPYKSEFIPKGSFINNDYQTKVGQLSKKQPEKINHLLNQLITFEEQNFDSVNASSQQNQNLITNKTVEKKVQPLREEEKEVKNFTERRNLFDETPILGGKRFD